MKKILLSILALIVIALGAFVYTFTSQPLDVPEGKAASLQSVTLPEGVSIRTIASGRIISSAALSYRGGNFQEERGLLIGGILVEHPNGSILFDAGFGANVSEHLKTIPWLVQKLIKVEFGKPIAEQLKSAGIPLETIKAIYITHAHWDHVSGAEDFKNIPVFMSKKEEFFITNGNPVTKLARQLIKNRLRHYDFKSGPYMGFEKSHDVYGDGSIVIVPMSGHTPGSIAAFVNTSDGKRYVLIGDTAWQKEGVDLPAERPWLSRKLADYNSKQIKKHLVRLHKLSRDNPDLIIVPAHDKRILDKLPQLRPGVE